mmetsp:Transcript_112372/g.210719  ORF Transcript_112372/g.210719 Transcript_112372/m.210719 type:complete len:812 (-) Transcript_112372:65-2500(-)
MSCALRSLDAMNTGQACPTHMATPSYALALWNLVIRPPRAMYNIRDLGPAIFEIGGLPGRRRDFQLRTERGVHLECSHFRPEPVKGKRERFPVVIYLHGNSSSRLEALDILQPLLGRRISLFCYDAAGCGMSEGEYVSLGWYERDDLASVVNHLREQPDCGAIGVWGRSMGAATALLHLEREDKIGGICADSPFASLPDVMWDLAQSEHMAVRVPSWLLVAVLALVRMRVRTLAGFDIEDVVPIRQAKTCRVPAMFVHARKDHFVPMHHSQRLYEAYGGRKEFLEIGGTHNSPRGPRVVDRIVDFFSRIFDREEYQNARLGQAITGGADTERPTRSSKQSTVAKKECVYPAPAAAVRIRYVEVPRESTLDEGRASCVATERTGATVGGSTVRSQSAPELRPDLLTESTADTSAFPDTPAESTSSSSSASTATKSPAAEDQEAQDILNGIQTEVLLLKEAYTKSIQEAIASPRLTNSSHNSSSHSSSHGSSSSSSHGSTSQASSSNCSHSSRSSSSSSSSNSSTHGLNACADGVEDSNTSDLSTALDVSGSVDDGAWDEKMDLQVTAYLRGHPEVARGLEQLSSRRHEGSARATTAGRTTLGEVNNTVGRQLGKCNRYTAKAQHAMARPRRISSRGKENRSLADITNIKPVVVDIANAGSDAEAEPAMTPPAVVKDNDAKRATLDETLALFEDIESKSARTLPQTEAGMFYRGPGTPLKQWTTEVSAILPASRKSSQFGLGCRVCPCTSEPPGFVEETRTFEDAVLASPSPPSILSMRNGPQVIEQKPRRFPGKDLAQQWLCCGFAPMLSAV